MVVSRGAKKKQHARVRRVFWPTALQPLHIATVSYLHEWQL